MGCLFCGIVEGKVPSRKAYEDDKMVAFHDINPQAPTHVLLVPRKHVTNLLELKPEDEPLIGALVSRARELAREMGFAERGFRLVGAGHPIVPVMIGDARLAAQMASRLGSLGRCS